jgi:UDP-glucose 4-epimerase
VRLFVTGGAGYVGSVVVEHLLHDGHEVTVFDDLSTGHAAAVPPGARLVVGDLRDTLALRQALDASTEAVLHFAAKSLVGESQRDPLAYYEHNVGGAISLLRVMHERGVQRFLFSSSAGVYGAPATQPIPESEPPRPTHAYGGSKRAIEMLLEDASRCLGLRAVWLRYFNAAGASARSGEDHRPETHLLPILLQAARASEPAPVPVYGDDYPTPDGTCIRDYVHVEDLASAHVLALRALDAGLQGAVNLGGGAGKSVLEILATVRRVTARPIPVRVAPRRSGDPPILVADASRAGRELGWRAARGLEAIVTSAWQWLQAHPGGYADGADGRGEGRGEDRGGA